MILKMTRYAKYNHESFLKFYSVIVDGSSRGLLKVFYLTLCEYGMTLKVAFSYNTIMEALCIRSKALKCHSALSPDIFQLPTILSPTDTREGGEAFRLVRGVVMTATEALAV